MTDERFFEIASEEIKAGVVRPGLRAKAFSEADGNEARSQALYLKYRAAQLEQADKEVRRSQRETERAKSKRGQGTTDFQVKRIDDQVSDTPRVFVFLVAVLIVGVIVWKFATATH